MDSNSVNCIEERNELGQKSPSPHVLATSAQAAVTPANPGLPSKATRLYSIYKTVAMQTRILSGKAENLLTRFFRLIGIMKNMRLKPRIRLPTDLLLGPPKVASHLTDASAETEVVTCTDPIVAVSTIEGSIYAIHGITQLLRARRDGRLIVTVQLATGLTEIDVRSHYPLVVLAAEICTNNRPISQMFVEYVWRREGPEFQHIIPVLRKMEIVSSSLESKKREIQRVPHRFNISRRALETPWTSPVPGPARHGLRMVSDRVPTPLPQRSVSGDFPLDGDSEKTNRTTKRGSGRRTSSRSPRRALQFDDCDDRKFSQTKRKASSPLLRNTKEPRRSLKRDQHHEKGKTRSARVLWTTSPQQKR